jgi:hypothetical protein
VFNRSYRENKRKLSIDIAFSCAASSDANGMVIYLGKLGQSLLSFQTGL